MSAVDFCQCSGLPESDKGMSRFEVYFWTVPLEARIIKTYKTLLNHFMLADLDVSSFVDSCVDLCVTRLK